MFSHGESSGTTVGQQYYQVDNSFGGSNGQNFTRGTSFVSQIQRSNGNGPIGGHFSQGNLP